MTHDLIPLTVDPDHDQLAQVASMMNGERCVVVGSAPLRTRMAPVDHGEFVICVNGAISSVVGVPDLWVLNSKPSKAHLHLTMLQQGKGREVRHIAFLRGTIRPTEQDSLRHLRKLGCAWTSWSVIDKPIKRWLEESTCARQPGLGTACSAGIFSAALALWSGAANVRLVGLSWIPGYHYLPHTQTIRGHVVADQRAVQTLLDRHPGRLGGALIPKTMAVAS